MIPSKKLDEHYNIVTEIQMPQISDKLKPEYSIYEPSDYSDLDLIFSYISLSGNDTLVDYGCGLGRILFYCNNRFACRVKGIEYDNNLYPLLQNNLENYLLKNSNQVDNILLQHITAEEYNISPEDNYFYLFNPFSTDILHVILKKIMASFANNKRKITIIFYYCTYEIMSTLRQYNFNLDKIIKLSNYNTDPNNKAYIYTLS